MQRMVWEHPPGKFLKLSTCSEIEPEGILKNIAIAIAIGIIHTLTVHNYYSYLLSIAHI